MSNTKEQIIEASLELFSKYGYKGTTTRLIAEKAGVNELTIFRNFGTKEEVLREIIEERYFYINKMLDDLKAQLVYDINKDLEKILDVFQTKLMENFNFIILFTNESEVDESTIKSFIRIPMSIKFFLTDYFDEIKKGGAIKEYSSETAALACMSMNLGSLLIKQRLFTEFSNSLPEDYLKFNMHALINGLQ